MVRSVLAFVAIALILSIPLLAFRQEPGTPQPIRPNSPTTSATNVPKGQTVEPPKQLPRPLFLSGKVMLEDGSAPFEPMQVEMVCNGSIIRQTLTSSKGDFSFEFGTQFANVMLDASASASPNPAGYSQDPAAEFGGLGSNGPRVSGHGRYDMTSCQVRMAPLPGFDANSISLGFRSVFDKPDVGTIVLTRREGVQGTTVSLNSLRAPKKAKKAYEKAVKQVYKQKPNLDKALKYLNEAIQIFPEFASAWDLLGRVHSEQKRSDEARAAFLKAYEVDSNFINPQVALASMAAESGRWREAHQWTSRLVELNPFLPKSQYLHALSSYFLGQWDQAFECLNKLAEQGQSEHFPYAYFYRGDILARRGEYTLAAAEYRRLLEGTAVSQALSQEVNRRMSAWLDHGLIAAADMPKPRQSKLPQG